MFTDSMNVTRSGRTKNVKSRLIKCSTYQIDNHHQIVPSQVPYNVVPGVHAQDDKHRRNDNLEPHHSVENWTIVGGLPHGSWYEAGGPQV